jgi:hypothetical protein
MDYNEKRYTEREMVDAQRAAFVRGTSEWWQIPRQGHRPGEAQKEQAVHHYPMPKVTRPRTLRRGWVTFKIEDGRLQTMVGSGEWKTWLNTSELSDLLAHPTEGVDTDD